MAPPIELSIPSTSLSSAASGNKPYTLYNITLRLPLRSFVVQKRYSEFAALHTTLTSLTGAPPPAPLPAKSWLRSTVSSPELTEQRRDGLERYLRAVAESPDRRWRDTPAWRAFLNLPASTAGSAASASGVRAATVISLRESAAVAAIDPGNWLDLHRELKRALHDARLSLARRDAAAEGGAGRSSPAAAEAGFAATRDLVKAGTLLTALGEGLKTLDETGRLGEGELWRRRDLIALSRVERDGLDKLSSSLGSGLAGGAGRSDSPAGSADKAALLGGAAGRRAGGRVLGGGPLPETQQTRELNNQGVGQLQQQLMRDQDADVEALGRILTRQREMALQIKDEVDAHTEMLGRMDEDVDRVAAKTKVAKDRVRRLG